MDVPLVIPVASVPAKLLQELIVTPTILALMVYTVPENDAAAGNVIATGYTNSPYISAFPWSSGFGTKYADAATLPTGTGNGVAFI